MTAHIITFPSTESAREYWRQRSIIDGTDWPSLGLFAARVFWRLQLTSSLCWEVSS